MVTSAAQAVSGDVELAGREYPKGVHQLSARDDVGKSLHGALGDVATAARRERQHKAHLHVFGGVDRRAGHRAAEAECVLRTDACIVLGDISKVCAARCETDPRLSPDGRSVAPVAASAARVIITCCVVELIWIHSALFGVPLLFGALRCCLRYSICLE